MGRKTSCAAVATAVALALSALAAATPAGAEPGVCLSPIELVWPKPSRPYFLVAFDTSAKMAAPAGAPASCPGYGSDRLAHARCALAHTFAKHDGQVRFGLETFATSLQGCAAACYAGCTVSALTSDGLPAASCGSEPDPAAPFSASRRGGNLVVLVQKDDFWNSPPSPAGNPALLPWVNQDCTGGKELFAGGLAAPNGLLRDALRYYQGAYQAPVGGLPLPSPLGTLAQGERSCRPANVLLISAGDDECDDPGDAADAAAALLAGFSKDGLSWTLRTFVVHLGPASPAMDAIAAAGGTGQAYLAADDAAIEQAIDAILESVKPPGESTCDNRDDDCNGCTDEGFTHYCNVGQTCCGDGTPAQRDLCLQQFEASINPQNPDGTTESLPCTTLADGWNPQGWLCANPKDTLCDETDNNCDGQVDEDLPLLCGNGLGDCEPGVVTCENGVPGCTGATGPVPEECDCRDNDCNGLVDDGPGLCSKGKECILAFGGCRCAHKCTGQKDRCPALEACKPASSSQTGEPAGDFCLPNNPCAACASTEIEDGDRNLLCAPEDARNDCAPVPVCVCKGFSCVPPTPCEGLSCPDGFACATVGPSPGGCVPDNCYNIPCPGCGKVCHTYNCIDNPCSPSSCDPGEVCKPSPDFMSPVCVPSCAGVACTETQRCVAGACKPACDPPCGPMLACDGSQQPPQCVDDPCQPASPCGEGLYCDPANGSCGDDPCTGVLCPQGQICLQGDCFGPGEMGAPCASLLDCQSAFCADGVCCDGACEGPCLGCTTALKGGGIEGTCGSIPAGQSRPDGACSADQANPCGQTGVCDGAGQCARTEVGVRCPGGQCFDGECRPNAACSSNLDCPPGQVCSAQGTCEPPIELAGPLPGCACSQASSPQVPPGSALLGAALAALTAARRRRRPPRPTPSRD